MEKWSEAQREYVEGVTVGLLEFGRTARGTFTDVVAWGRSNREAISKSQWEPLYVAFVGDALKVSRLFGYTPEGGGVRGPVLDHHLVRALRLPERTDFAYESNVTFPDFLDRMGGQILYNAAIRYGDGSFPFTEGYVRFIPEPGYPWPADWYWSAKAQRIIEPQKPGWLMPLKPKPEEGQKERIGVNPCKVFPPEDSRTVPGGPVCGRLGKHSVMVAHTMTLLPRDKDPSFHKQIDAAIEGVRSCGGLLFPSLSVGSIPASNFGPITLVAHLELLLKSLKPYRGRGKFAPLWVYDTDAWTAGTAELMDGVAERLFEELHGHEDYMYGHHMWVLGPPSDLFTGPRGESRPMETTKQLARAVERRMRKFPRDIDPLDFAEVSKMTGGTIDHYAYCEAKGREVVSLDEFPFMIGPTWAETSMRDFAKGVGYKGRIVALEETVGLTDETAPGWPKFTVGPEEREYAQFQWAWQVADAVGRLKRPQIAINL